MNWKSDILWVVVGRLFFSLVYLLSIRISTGLLEPDQYTILGMLVAIQTFCGLIFINPIGQYINRNCQQWWQDQSIDGRMKTFQYYVVVTSLIGGVVASIWFSIFDSGNGFNKFFLANIVILMIWGATWNVTWSSVINILEQRALAVKLSLFAAVCGLLMSALLCYSNPTPEMWFLGQAIGNSIGAIAGGYAMRSIGLIKAKSPVKLIDASAIKKYCLPLACSTPFIWLQLSGYRLIMPTYWDLTIVGMALAGIGLSLQAWILVETIVVQILIPKYYKILNGSDGAVIPGYEGNNKQQVDRLVFSDLINIVGPFYLFFAAITLVLAPSLVFLIVDEKYILAAHFFAIGSFVELCRVMFNLFANAAQINQNTKLLVLPNIISGSVMTALVVYAGTQKAPMDTVVWAMVTGGLAALMVLMIRIRRQISFKIDYTTWGISLAILLTACWIKIAYSSGAYGVPEIGMFTAICLILTAMIVYISVFTWKNNSFRRLISA